jgi:hypothetical protein
MDAGEGTSCFSGELIGVIRASFIATTVRGGKSIDLLLYTAGLKGGSRLLVPGASKIFSPNCKERVLTKV